MTDSATDIEILYRGERKRLENRLRRLIGNKFAAADLVHDLFLRLWEKRGEAREDARLYLMRSARNAAIDHIRSERIRADFLARIAVEQIAAPISNPHEIVAARQTLSRVDTAIDALPERSRHVFLLNRVHGCSYSEIAVALGISASAVEKHMTRGLKAIRQAVEEA